MASEKPLLAELRERITRSKGLIIEGFLWLLEEAYYAVDVNHRELLQGVRKVTDPAVAIDLLLLENRKKLIRVRLEIARLLQNYLDSADSFHDRINKLVKGAMPELIDAWDKRWQEAKKEPVNAFVTELRVYVHHTRQPVITSIFGFEQRHAEGFGFSAMVSISRHRIENVRDWGKYAMRYMKSLATDEILLDQLVLDHFPLLEDLAQWVLGSVRQTYKTELDELEDLRKQYRLEYEKAFGSAEGSHCEEVG